MKALKNGGWKHVRKELWKNRFLYLMLAIPLLYFFVFKYGAIGWLGIAFKNYNARAGLWKSKGVGLKYFKMFLNDPYYNQPVQPGLLFSGAYYPGADDQRGERGPEEEIRTDGYISSLFHINGCPTLIWSKVLRVYCVYSV